MKETLEEAAEIEKIAMDKLKNKWSHLYQFGYPQKPFPTNYENDLNNIKVGLCEGAKRRYSEEEVMSILTNSLHSVELKDNKDYSKIYNGMKEWFEQFKKK